jgi:hypothetical protein
MWRSLFLAIGITACILGSECLVVEKAVLAAKQDPLLDESQNGFAMPFLTGDYQPPQREFTPPDWAPWSLISIGAITMIYSFTIPRLVAS